MIDFLFWTQLSIAGEDDTKTGGAAFDEITVE